MRQIQEKSVLLQVGGEFESPSVRVIGVQLFKCSIYYSLANLKSSQMKMILGCSFKIQTFQKIV